MTFYVSQSEWDEANQELKGKPDGTKLDKYPFQPKKNFKAKWLQLRTHSFVILNKVIYALSNKEDFSLSKKGQNIFGDQVILEKTKMGTPKYKIIRELSYRSTTIFEPSNNKENEHSEAKPITSKHALIFSSFQQAAQLPDLFSSTRQEMPFAETKNANVLKQVDLNRNRLK